MERESVSIRPSSDLKLAPVAFIRALALERACPGDDAQAELDREQPGALNRLLLRRIGRVYPFGVGNRLLGQDALSLADLGDAQHVVLEAG